MEEYGEFVLCARIWITTNAMMILLTGSCGLRDLSACSIRTTNSSPSRCPSPHLQSHLTVHDMHDDGDAVFFSSILPLMPPHTAVDFFLRQFFLLSSFHLFIHHLCMYLYVSLWLLSSLPFFCWYEVICERWIRVCVWCIHFNWAVCFVAHSVNIGYTTARIAYRRIINV